MSNARAEHDNTIDLAAEALPRLEKRATFDALTGTHNRSSILSAVQTEVDHGDAQTTAIVYVDIDNFKLVNDTHGHAAGDELLVLVAERLKAVSRRDDSVGRLGGDEFIMLLRSVSEAEAAVQVAHRISECLSRAVVIASEPIHLRASLGVACTGAEPMTAEELVRRAGAAMYLSKAQEQGLPVLDVGHHGRLAHQPS